jgi:CHAT domain-containing protein
MRSGLILAGANKLGLANGMITSRELLGVNLYGTELVVLSACETGLGVVTAGEGVMGMRRSFLNSGARTLVTSLWKVPDKETKDLMTLFYRKKLAGMPTAAALRQAMLESREARKKSNGVAHPYYWSAFIVVGNPN